MASFLRLLAVVLLAAATITVSNNCGYTVWPAAVPGGGEVLNTGESWSIHVPAGTRNGRVWGRTGCGVISNNGTLLGQCQTGDCGGTLACGGKVVVGADPVTLAEYSLGTAGRGGADVSLVHGFNVPMSFRPRRDGGGRRCASGGPSCPVQAITFDCPSEQRRVAGCGNPCAGGKGGGCGPNNGTEYLKKACPQTITYPRDTVYTCPAGTNYVITFAHECDRAGELMS